MVGRQTAEIRRYGPRLRGVAVSFTWLCTGATERQLTGLSVAKPPAHREGRIREEIRHCLAGAPPVPLSSG